MNQSPYTRRSLLTLAAMGILLPVILWGCWQAMSNSLNAPILWLPPDFQQRQELEQFKEHFKSVDAVIISWEGCTVDDERLERFAHELTSAHKTPNGDLYTDLFLEVANGYTAVKQLTRKPLELSREETIKRLTGTLVGPDGRTSCAVIVLKQIDKDQRQATLDAILDTAQKQVGLPRDQFHLAGTLVESLTIDAVSSRSFYLFALPSALLSLLICRVCLKSWRLTLAVAAVAGFGEGLVLSLIYFCGATMNAVLIVMAPLVLVLTVSSGVHLVNYFHDEVRLRGPLGATDWALAAGWAPCTLAALTTAIGLGSLLVSDIVPVRNFGAFASIGVITTVALLFLVVPGAMQWWSRGRGDENDVVPQTPSANLAGVWNGLTNVLSRLSFPITLANVALMAVCAAGLIHIDTSVSIWNLLADDSPTIRDYRWLEENIGPLAPIEVIVHFDPECPLGVSQKIELLGKVAAAIDKIDILDGEMSAATFMPVQQARGFRKIAQRSMILKKLQPEFIQARWLYEDDHRQSWRISARVRTLGEVDYGSFLADLRQRVELELEAVECDGIRATYTGVTPVVYQAQHALLNDFFNSFLTALVLVAVVMMLVLRNPAAGLVAMIPNVFPALVLFGTMGWLGVKIDIGTVMTASVALGIAVDDTIHFVLWFRRERAGGKSRRDAVQATFHHCALAMVQTTMICGLGLLVFALSDFVPTQRFAWMMFALLVAALVGDMLLLPALLLGPAGKLFGRPAHSDLDAKVQADSFIED